MNMTKEQVQSQLWNTKHGELVMAFRRAGEDTFEMSKDDLLDIIDKDILYFIERGCTF